MKDLLVTTALIGLIAAVPLHAQTTTTTGTTADSGAGMGSSAAISPPEGFTEYDRMALTLDDLQGAAVYDANGEAVGKVSELVMAANSTGAAGSTDTASTGMDATGDGTGDDTTGSTTDGTAAGDTGAEVSTDGKVSHVVLEVGGFLGIGVHRVAVPIGALQVFRAANKDLRVYLPWTQAQLEALPAYDANDPATLGAGMGGTMGGSMAGDAATGGGAADGTSN